MSLAASIVTERTNQEFFLPFPWYTLSEEKSLAQKVLQETGLMLQACWSMFSHIHVLMKALLTCEN